MRAACSVEKWGRRGRQQALGRFTQEAEAVGADGIDLELLRVDLLQLVAAPHAKGVVRTEVVEAAVGVRRVAEDERRGIVRPELTRIGDVALVPAQRLQRTIVLQAGELACRAQGNRCKGGWGLSKVKVKVNTLVRGGPLGA